MDAQNSLFLFIFICLIIELTPGPNMAYLTLLSLNLGRKAGFTMVAGVALGLAFIGIAAAFGVAALLSESPLAYEAIRLCGGVYLLWLAWDSWWEEKTYPDMLQSSAYKRYFYRGIITNILNPKAMVFYVALLPGFVTPQTDTLLLSTLLLTSVYITIATLVHIMLVLLASHLHTFINDDFQRMLLRRGSAMTLVVVAVWFFLKTGKG